jgi:transforming growth factor-beta-induced protein
MKNNQPTQLEKRKMRTLFSKLMVFSITAIMLVVIGCSDDDNNPIVNNGPTMDIVETAAADGRFTTLLAAATAADLVDALKSEGPLTVFAPTDDAFNALPAGTVEALLQDTAALTAVLTYHVVIGEVTSAQVVTLDSAATLNGAKLNITVNSNGSVMVDGANIIIKDIATTNGIIHVIDAVITPPSSQSGTAKMGWGSFGYSMGGGWIATAIVEGRLNWLTRHLSIYNVARLAGLKTLTTAVKAADLKYTLKRSGPFTVFAPTEDAFAALPEGTIPALLQDPETLANILLYHVTPGKVTASTVVTLNGEMVEMANGGNVVITVDENGVMVNDANVIAVDIMARNGVIHVIDGVLLP